MLWGVLGGVGDYFWVLGKKSPLLLSMCKAFVLECFGSCVVYELVGVMSFNVSGL